MHNCTGRQATLLALMAALLGIALGGGSQLAQEECGAASLDNDLNDTDLEIYCADPALEPGDFRTTDDDGDGDFDSIFVGTKGAGSIFGWAEFEGRPEMELVISDPTAASGSIRTADADQDQDAEAIWIGTRGLDLNQNGLIEPEEHGLVAGFADIDGDGDLEIIVLDKTRALQEHFAGAFGIDIENKDRLEVLWIGILNESRRTAIGAISGIVDLDNDGDDEVLLRDLSKEPQEFALDVDGDGDPDIVISVPN